MTECSICGSTENLDEHHTSYEPEETVTLCRSCHKKVHTSNNHPLKPDDSSGYTTIRITNRQKEFLNDMTDSDISNQGAVEMLIEHYNDTPNEERVRELAREEIRDAVVLEALE